MRSIVIVDKQSVFDVAVQLYGDVTRAFDLVKWNGLNGITSLLHVGDTLVYEEVELVGQRIAYMAEHSPIATLGENDQARGIGYWRINKDFKING